ADVRRMRPCLSLALFGPRAMSDLSPECAPKRTSADRSEFMGSRPSLLTLPVRRALVEEGIHSLAKILAHIGAKDQILALVARQRPPDPAHRLLGDLERDRRV